LHVQGLPEPFPQPLGGDDAAHQAACAAVLNRTMEHQIRQFPEQYLWGYHRYKQPRRDQAGDGVNTS
jgi:KDO2-lipid IV(A) lauroyltransferase